MTFTTGRVLLGCIIDIMTWILNLALAFLLMQLKFVTTSKLHKSEEEKALCLNRSPKHFNSYLWRIESQPPSYLFGTIHVRYDFLWNYIPKNMKYILRSVDALYTELNFNNRTTLETLNKCRFLKRNKTLKNILPKELYQRLRQHLERVRKTIINWLPNHYRNPIIASNVFQLLTRNWERRGPIWIVILVMNDLTPSGVMSNQRMALDIFLGSKAKSKRKLFHGLEDVSDQCDPFNQLKTSEAIFLLNHVLNLQELYLRDEVRRRYSMEQNALVEHYKCGNLQSLLKQTGKLLPPLNITPVLTKQEKQRIAAIDQYFIEELLHKRNIKMANRIEHVLTTSKHSTLFALGVGHFFGNGSVISHLRERGIGVSHISPVEVLPGQLLDEQHRKRRREKRRRKTTAFEEEWRRKLANYDNNVKKVKTLLNKTERTVTKQQKPQQVNIYKRVHRKNTYVYYYSGARTKHSLNCLQQYLIIIASVTVIIFQSIILDL